MISSGEQATGYRLIEFYLNQNPGRNCAALTSFGSDSPVLLHLISQLNPDLPVIFVDTGMHFTETLDFRDRLTEVLRLTDVRTVKIPDSALAQIDSNGWLHRIDPDLCCRHRKVQPLEQATGSFSVIFNGRKRYQGATRQGLAGVEKSDNGSIRINPLYNWTETALNLYKEANKLPRHPLEIHGYKSIGCRTCTRAGNATDRSGRWVGSSKTECGIFFNSSGTAVRLNNFREK